VSLSRRDLLHGVAGAATLGTTAGWTDTGNGQTAPLTAPPRTVVLTATMSGTGSYTRLPFQVPTGTTRIDVRMTKSEPTAALGIGLFDARGDGYQSPGFRGIYGEERSQFFVSTAAASEAFMPGPMPAGQWTVLVPVFKAPLPTRVTVEVTMSFAPQGAPFRPGPKPGVVLDEPGWYRGDLHCHTTASSDAWSSGSAMTPVQWADACRKAGLDFVAMTDPASRVAGWEVWTGPWQPDDEASLAAWDRMLGGGGGSMPTADPICTAW
jgi:hypothetical protein